MSEVRVPVQLCGKRSCQQIEDALVDTGSIHSWIPEKLAAQLGFEVEEMLDVDQMDGPPFKAPAGALKMKLNGIERTVPVAVTKGDLVIVGVTALETMRFEVDPITGRIRRKRQRGPLP